MKQLKVIEKNERRVLTSEQIAEAFGTDIAKIRYNFNYNKKRYVEGKHYIALTGEARTKFLNEFEIHTGLKHAHTIYLWTEKGAFLHAKSLNTDKAWNAYSELVDDYFAKVEQVQRMNVPTTIPTTIEDILALAVVNMKDLRNEINVLRVEAEQIKQENRNLKLVVDNEVWLTDNQLAQIQEAVNKRCGQLVREGYGKAHFQGIYRTLKDHFEVPSYKKLKRTDFERAVNIIKGWYPKKAENTGA